MRLLIMMSLRNLFRQKRRNVLLGAAMTIGVAILVMASSYANGITDIMYNKIMRWAMGHVAVNFAERGQLMRQVCRDYPRFRELLKGEEALTEEVDEAMGYMCRAVGNGKSALSMVIGIDISNTNPKSLKETEEAFRLVEGNWRSLDDPKIEHPLILSIDKAKALNVKMDDKVKLRLTTISGQNQSATMTVVGLLKLENIFMEMVMFTSLKDLKAIRGFRPHETGNIILILNEPEKDAVAIAERLQKKISENTGTAVIEAGLTRGGRKATAVLLGLKAGEDFKKRFEEFSSLKYPEKDAIVTRALADGLGLKKGSAFTAAWLVKYTSEKAEFNFTVADIMDREDLKGKAAVFLPEGRFVDLYSGYLPALPKEKGSWVPGKEEAWTQYLAPEWIMMPRAKTTDETTKRYKEAVRKKYKSTQVSVSTMYETGSAIMKLEYVLKIITFAAVLVLFAIILIGVVNTLRMTVRERTREIGTMRAIGMQKRDVRAAFLMETGFLAVISALTGVLLAMALMALLSQYTFTMEDNPLAMFLVHGHLYFLPTFLGVLGYILLIVLIAVGTAYFPSKKAAALSPAAALRHFD